ncbi:MAG: M14 family metallopeptidase [Flavobacteriaceae bacterium]
MKKLIFVIIPFLFLTSCEAPHTNRGFETVFETSHGKETPTYHDLITYYENLADAFSEIKIETIGETDSGEPLHLVWYNSKGIFNNNSNARLLINNGIHPGESDGIDATMLLFRDLALGKITAPKNTTITTIPVYNVGGCLNRNSATRTNQNGPKEYGFRGNARNFDLNRDFIKSDTKNAKTFAEIFHKVNPDVFIDNHVSNGADYQYAISHLFTQHNKLGGVLGNYLHQQLMPNLENDLKTKNIPITPYVNVWGTTPESGWSQFMDYPRYSTGYTTLFNTLGMMVETHMLKPYKQRVEQTYELMQSMLTLVDNDYKNIKNLRQQQFDSYKTTDDYVLDWKVDSTKTTTLNFKGYEANYTDSKVTSGKRLFYNKQKPYTKEVTYYNYVKPKNSIAIPKGYVIPKNWHRVINLLKINNIEMTELKQDSTLTVESYKIDDYKTVSSPFEGHYMHYNTEVKTTIKNISFKKGDYLINTKQPNIRYLLTTLEPQAPDSFFNWNYFDTILQQKEHFSAYVFEDNAEILLNNTPELKAQFETKKLDSVFANNSYLQLDWIHKNSPHYEISHLQYPIYRMF